MPCIHCLCEECEQTGFCLCNCKCKDPECKDCVEENKK
jgi:hypothetical protein